MIVSFASGYIIFFVLALIQIPVVRYLIKQRHKYLHSIVSNLFHLIAFVSTVQIWRSLWLICEQYLNITSCHNIALCHNITLWLCYGGSFLVLTCGLAACSLNGPGGSKDSYIDEGPILLFKFDYFSSLLKVSFIVLIYPIVINEKTRKRIKFYKTDIFCFQQQNSDETVPSQTKAQSGILLWLITNVLRRQQHRRNTLTSQSRRNTITSIDAPPSISETVTIN